MIADYFPAPEELNMDDTLAARLRVTAFLKNWWPDLDTRPNSVFGDLAASPMAVMLAGLETAWAKQASDLDLSRVSRGIIANPEFVEAFLANFGVSSRNAVASSGAIRLTFSVNKTYTIDADATFAFGSDTFKANPDEGNPIIIQAVGGDGQRVLVRTDEGEYTVFLPVTGNPGVSVQDGSEATHLLPHPEIISVTAAGDFDPGSSGESLPALAERARRGSAAAHFCSRAGVISFMTRTWPNLVAASPTITGDREMIRAGANVLGVIDGAIDVYLRSQPSFAFGESVLPLTWDQERQGWVGQLSLPVPPAFFAINSGIFQVGNFRNNRSLNTVFSKSNHPVVDNLGVAYSKYETLGVLVEDTKPQDFNDGYVGEITETTSTGAQLKVVGQYSGHVFHSRQSRSLSVRMDSMVTIDFQDMILARVKDALSGESAVVYFVPNSISGPTFGQIKKDDDGYRKMFNGLDVELRTAGGSWNIPALLNSRFVLAFKGKTANFHVNYLYEPLLTSVEAAVNDPDNRPVQTSIFAKSFVPCNIEQFLVHYRVRFGNQVDLKGAQSDIFQYLNTLAFPQVYDESKIGEILVARGASGLASVQKSGLFYPSLANVYVSKSGVESAVPRIATNTLLPPQNDLGFGARNIAYVISLETIQFNGTVF